MNIISRVALTIMMVVGSLVFAAEDKIVIRETPGLIKMEGRNNDIALFQNIPSEIKLADAIEEYGTKQYSQKQKDYIASKLKLIETAFDLEEAMEGLQLTARPSSSMDVSAESEHLEDIAQRLPLEQKMLYNYIWEQGPEYVTLKSPVLKKIYINLPAAIKAKMEQVKGGSL